MDQARVESIRNVAIVSLIGDQVRFLRLGFIAFQNEDRTQRVDWQADKQANAIVQQILKSKGISAVPVEYDPGNLAAGLYKTAAFEPLADPRRIQDDLRNVIRGTSIDALVLIANGRTSTGPIDYEGPGLYTEGTLKERLPVQPYLALSLFVLEAETLKVLASSTQKTTGTMYNLNPLFGLAPTTPPAPFFAGFTFPMNDEQANFLRDTLRELLPVALESALQQVGF